MLSFYLGKVSTGYHEKCKSLSFQGRVRRPDRQSEEEEMKGKFGEQHTAGLSSLWGQRPGRHLRSRFLLLLFLSSSLSSPLGGAASSSASPAPTGWSPGTHRWAWLLRHLLSKDLKKQDSK